MQPVDDSSQDGDLRDSDTAISLVELQTSNLGRARGGRDMALTLSGTQLAIGTAATTWRTSPAGGTAAMHHQVRQDSGPLGARSYSAAQTR